MTASAHVLDAPDAGSAAARGGALRVGAYLLGTLLSVVAAALIFHHLGVADGGRYVTIVALVAMVGGLSDAGLSTIAVRELVARDARDRGAVMGAMLALRVALTLAGVAVAVLFALAAGYERAMVSGAAIAGGALLLQALQGTLAAELTADLRLGWVAACDVLRQLVGVGWVVAVVAFGGGLAVFFTANLPGFAVVLALTWWLVRERVQLAPAAVRAEWRGLLRDALPFALASAVGAIYFRVAVVLVSLIATARETGWFGASFRGIEVLIVIPQLVVGAAFPLFARAAAAGALARLEREMHRVWDACVLLGVGVALVLLVGAPVIVQVIAGPGFGPAAGVLRIQAVALVASFLAAPWGYALLGLRDHRAIVRANLAGLAVNVTLVSVLAAAGGVRWAAAATVLAETLICALYGRAMSRHGVRRLGDARLAVIALAAAAVGALPVLLPGVPLVVRTALCVVVYAGLLAASGALRRG
ncbi:MAG TPA: polysaccharide biosynthesis C-terminal domain-containing protein [Solirubrobacteraceae bacterium]|nr:polysaccharide biosynthesis C-terminal domain-containing protein [Solirubrobacteraceae bacterium]